MFEADPIAVAVDWVGRIIITGSFACQEEESGRFAALAAVVVLHELPTRNVRAADRENSILEDMRTDCTVLYCTVGVVRC
jgi:hypothetical protein